jgi:hypothetical protein
MITVPAFFKVVMLAPFKWSPWVWLMRMRSALGREAKSPSEGST